MDQMKEALTILYNYIVEILKYFEVFPEEFFDFIGGLFEKEAE